jgi:hypothetical protein
MTRICHFIRWILLHKISMKILNNLCVHVDILSLHILRRFIFNFLLTNCVSSPWRMFHARQISNFFKKQLTY